MSKRDYYEILEVSRTADDGEIKKSFRRLAMKFHPDRNPDNKEAEESFKEIKEAYEILCDADKRRMYDQFGHAGVNGAGGGGFSGGGFGFGDIFEDLFGNMFGAGRARGGYQGQAGADLGYNLTLSLEEAITGKTVSLDLPTYEACKECTGSGARKGTSPVTCESCQGMGQVQLQQGFFTVQQTCPTCRGAGRMIKDPCGACRGSGRKKTQKTLSVKVPAGVDTGDRIRLSGEGEAGTGGAPAGDLYVQVQVQEHPVFKRDGGNLHCDIPISFVTAALGGDLEIPTLSRKVKLQIPAETQTGKLFRLRGKGVKTVRNTHSGDLICRVIIETPVHLSKTQKELLKQLDASMQEGKTNHSPKSTSWLANVKKFFETTS